MSKRKKKKTGASLGSMPEMNSVPVCSEYSNLRELYGLPEDIFNYFRDMPQEEFLCYDFFVGEKIKNIDAARFLRFMVDITNRFKEMPKALQPFIDMMNCNVGSKVFVGSFLRELGIPDPEVHAWFFDYQEVISSCITEVISGETYLKKPELILSTYAFLFNIRESTDEFFDDMIAVMETMQLEEIRGKAEEYTPGA